MLKEQIKSLLYRPLRYSLAAGLKRVGQAARGVQRAVHDVEQRQKQGLFFPDKISGVGTNFGLLVHILPGPNKEREAK